MSQPSDRMPVLFLGHGSPMNAIDDNAWSRGFQAIGAALPRPAAILSISAHWYVGATLLTANEAPPTIHDFGGFPRALFEVQYPARGSVDLAARVAALLASRRAALSGDWGLDHGTWSVLRHLRPAADVPVVQLSIDRRLPPAEHLAIGRALAPLRDQGVLVMGSGNVTHNLHHAMRNLGRPGVPTPDWAARFDRDVAAALEQHDGPALAQLVATDDGRQSHPSIDHYLPLLYAVGAASADDPVSFPVTGWDAGSLSMRSVKLGG
jgi:4,5-DOPA dioxygenase extradiol